MPISVTCSECDKSLKVADTMAGKSFKCPGCKAVIKAPAGGTPTRAANTTPTKKPARKEEDEEERPVKRRPRDEEEDERPARRSRRDEEDDDDDDDRPRNKRKAVERLEEEGEDLPIEEMDIRDSDVPEHIQERIEQELTKSEKLYWVGMPSRKIVLMRSLWGPIVGLFILLICLGIALAMAGNAPPGSGFPIMAIMMPGFFGLIFTGSLFSLPFYNLWKAGRTCYAVTNRRAIVWQAGWFGGVEMENYSPGRLANMWRRDNWLFNRGGGDLVFRSVTTITVTTGRNGGVSQSTTYYGFLAIENVRKVERLVREVLVDGMG